LFHAKPKNVFKNLETTLIAKKFWNDDCYAPLLILE